MIGEPLLERALRELFERYGPFNPFKNYAELARDLRKILDGKAVLLSVKEYEELTADQKQFRKIRGFIEEYQALAPAKVKRTL